MTPGTNWFFKFFRGKVGARNLKKKMQTDTQTNKQTDRQTDRHALLYID